MNRFNPDPILATGGLLARIMAWTNVRPGFECTSDLPEFEGCLDAPQVVHAGSMLPPANPREALARFQTADLRA